jgi:hypothetical protein
MGENVSSGNGNTVTVFLIILNNDQGNHSNIVLCNLSGGQIAGAVGNDFDIHR